MLSSIAIIAILVSGAVAAPMDYQNPGEWLTSELGLKDAKAANEAIAVLNEPWVSPKDPEDVPVDQDLLDRRDSMLKKLRNTDYATALLEIEQLLKDPRIAERRESSLNMAEFELFLHEDKMIALKMQNRLIEALVEAQLLKKLCSRPNGPSPRLIEGLLELLESEFEKSNNFNRVQVDYVSKPEEVRQSFEKLNGMLSKASEDMPESKVYFDNVANIVQTAHEALKN